MEKMGAEARAYRERHAGALPANPDLPPMGSFAEDFPEQHRKNGERSGAKPSREVSAEVRVKPHDAEGVGRVETWTGISKRHALVKAREHYRDVARCDFADGEPW